MSEAEAPRLKALHERAVANGAPARLISGDDAREFEPNVAAVAALRVESTDIIDYSAVSAKLAELETAHGAELLLGIRVTDIRVTDREVTVVHDRGTVTADLLINCAGLQSDRIAAMAAPAATGADHPSATSTTNWWPTNATWCTG